MEVNAYKLQEKLDKALEWTHDAFCPVAHKYDDAEAQLFRHHHKLLQYLISSVKTDSAPVRRLSYTLSPEAIEFYSSLGFTFEKYKDITIIDWRI